MFQVFMALVVGGLAGMIGYGLGAAFTDELIWSLALGGIGFALGFGLWMALASRGARDEQVTWHE